LSASRVPEFYQYAIHLVYAVIIALSFDVATEIFMPIQNFFESYDNFLKGMGLLLVYVVVISGWVGWTKSIIGRPHRINFYGNLRFVLDLFIGFWYFYLIQLAKPEHFNEFNQIFIWVFPAIFVTYIIWDFAKFKEYNFKNQEREVRGNRVRKTLYFTVLFFAVALIYTHVDQNNRTIIVYENNIVDFIFIVVSIILTLLYRKSKWKETRIKRIKKKNSKGAK